MRGTAGITGMEGIWTLVACLGLLCSAAPAATQNSSRTWFLVSGPDVLHAGTRTPLALTVLTDFPGRVVAEVAQGNSTVTQTEDFQGGTTTILTLPPIPESWTKNSLVNMTVRGYRGDSLIFTNTTSLRFSHGNVSTFLQTDRSCYQPGDTVKIRAVSVQLDNRPYKGRVDLSIQDPSGNVVDSWESIGNLGIVLREFTLSRKSPLGQWGITAAVNGVADQKTFDVEHHEPPPFEVLFRTPSRILAGADFSGSVRAMHPSGQPVQGTLAVTVTLASLLPSDSPPVMLTQTKEIYGSAQFFFSKDQFGSQSSSAGSSDGSFHVSACVTDSSTGLKVNRTVKVHVMMDAFQLEFQDFPRTLKPLLHFFSKLRISRSDQKQLSSVDFMHSAVIEVTQRTSATKDGPPTRLVLPVPEDGVVHMKFPLQEGVTMLFIRARFLSSEKTLKVYNSYSSPSSSYIQISPVNSPAQIGSPLQLAVESTFQPTTLHFVVSSRGQVVAAGTKNSTSFFLTPTMSWSPEAHVTVFYILSDGEVTSDTAHIPILQHNSVFLKWSSDKAQPGEQVSLSATSLEPGSQIGIMVMGVHGEEPQADLDMASEQQGKVRMLTNAILHEEKQLDGPRDEGGALLVETYWSHWLDDSKPLLWLDTNVSDNSWTSGKITVPDGVTALRAAALVMSENMGLSFTPVPPKLSVSKDFSLFLDLPSHLVKGEEIVLEVKTINHLERDIEVILLLAQNEAFDFVLEDRGDLSVVNAQRVTLGSHMSASSLFPIRAVAVGVMEISVDAVSAEASDSRVWTVHVKPEGVEQSFSETLFLELLLAKQNNTRSISMSFPADVVPGSQRAHVALVGDTLALSINHLDSLVQMPLGCGEQNMIHFAPSIYVVKYLDISTQDDKEIRNRALGYMMDAYQRQLTYQLDDGSFSAFGSSDSSGSTWLTAFVLRCFLQAQEYIKIQQRVLTRAMAWLLKRQGPRGDFSEVGRVIHTQMQGGLDDGPVALTAFVLMALLEDDSYVDMYPGNVSRAQTYLEDKVSSGGLSNYSLCLVAYALALANSKVAGTALTELNRRADYNDGVMMWSSAGSQDSSDGQPGSAQIEMASYVLLALYKRGSFVEGISLMKWLIKQKTHRGGYRTTQVFMLLHS
ncbi:uncharacterized protein V6R79_019950 [Siganus canaliculatus]